MKPFVLKNGIQKKFLVPTSTGLVRVTWSGLRAIVAHADGDGAGLDLSFFSPDVFFRILPEVTRAFVDILRDREVLEFPSVTHAYLALQTDSGETILDLTTAGCYGSTSYIQDRVEHLLESGVLDTGVGMQNMPGLRMLVKGVPKTLDRMGILLDYITRLGPVGDNLYPHKPPSACLAPALIEAKEGLVNGQLKPRTRRLVPEHVSAITAYLVYSHILNTPSLQEVLLETNPSSVHVLYTTTRGESSQNMTNHTVHCMTEGLHDDVVMEPIGPFIDVATPVSELPSGEIDYDPRVESQIDVNTLMCLPVAYYRPKLATASDRARARERIWKTKMTHEESMRLVPRTGFSHLIAALHKWILAHPKLGWEDRAADSSVLQAVAYFLELHPSYVCPPLKE